MARGRKTGGRKKGTPNKVTASVKEAIESAFANAGGAAYLEQVARDDPKTFCALLGKVLPRQMDLAGDPDLPMKTIIEIIDPTRPE